MLSYWIFVNIISWTLPKGHKKTLCFGLQRLQLRWAYQHVFLKWPISSTNFRSLLLTCPLCTRPTSDGWDWDSQSTHRAGGMSKPARRKRQRAHWKSWLIPSWGSFVQKEPKLDSQHETYRVLCVFGYRQPAYSLLLKHSWKKWFATEIFLLSFKCKWLWLLYATYANCLPSALLNVCNHTKVTGNPHF